MSPRQLRSEIQRGVVTSTDPRLYKGKTPEPPPEWPEWRRRRLRVAVRAAVLFLNAKTWHEISRVLEKENLLGAERASKGGEVVSKARICQYVDRGVQFLIQRGCFRTTGRNGAK